MSDDQTKQHPAQKIARSILANEVAYNANHDLLMHAPEFFKRDLKNAYKNYIEKLKDSQPEYDLLFLQQEDATVASYDAIDSFYKTASKIQVYDMENAAAVLEAFLLDPKSLQGVTNKILKYKK